ncbi:MAG: hypothetical protein WCF35_03575, partial [Pseudolabrys sp.]
DNGMLLGDKNPLGPDGAEYPTEFGPQQNWFRIHLADVLTGTSTAGSPNELASVHPRPEA